MNCKFCEAALPPGTHGKREYCNDAHKQAFFRQKHQQDQNEASLSELANLRTKVKDQGQEIEELAQENTLLKTRLDGERRYLEDKEVRGFKAWLKKQPRSAFAVKLFNDDLVPPRGSRALYQGHVRRLLPEEMEEFARLWKLMLLSQP